MRIRILGILTCALLAAGFSTAQSGLKISAGTVIVVSPDAPGPVRKAVEDLAGDMEKVLGPENAFFPCPLVLVFVITVT